MGKTNRDFQSSNNPYFFNLRNATTGNTGIPVDNIVYQTPQPTSLVSARISAVGLSNTPSVLLQIQRFVTGAGSTLIPLGTTLALQAVSTSGPQTYTFSATSLNSGDRVVASIAGLDGAAEQVAVGLVINDAQSIRTWNW